MGRFYFIQIEEKKSKKNIIRPINKKIIRPISTHTHTHISHALNQLNTIHYLI